MRRSRKNPQDFYSLRSPGVEYKNIDIYYDYRTVKDICKPGRGLCLDIGSRDSKMKSHFERLGYRYVGMDIDYHEALDVLADGGMLPFRADCFDLVVLSQVLEHVPDPAGLMKEVWRVAKNDGKVIGSVSFLEPYHKSLFNMSYRAVELLLMKCNFKSITIETGVTGHVLMLARLFGMLGSSRTDLFSKIARFCFPLRSILKLMYAVVRFQKFCRGRNMAEINRNLHDHYESIALSLAGHILFSATK